jgi:hypothetical protein
MPIPKAAATDRAYHRPRFLLVLDALELTIAAA